MPVPICPRNDWTRTYSTRDQVPDCLVITIFKCTSSHTLLNGCLSGDLFILICRHSIKRLAGNMRRELDQTAKLAFMVGFQDSISITLQHLPCMNKMEIMDLIPTERVSTRTWSLDSRTVRAVAHGKKSTDRCQEPHWLRDYKVAPRTKIMCYNCKFGYIARYCSLIQGNKEECLH